MKTAGLLSFKTGIDPYVRSAMLLALDDIANDEQDSERIDRISNEFGRHLREVVNRYDGLLSNVPILLITQGLYARRYRTQSGTVAYHIHTLARLLEDINPSLN